MMCVMIETGGPLYDEVAQEVFAHHLKVVLAAVKAGRICGVSDDGCVKWMVNHHSHREERQFSAIELMRAAQIRRYQIPTEYYTQPQQVPRWTHEAVNVGSIPPPLAAGNFLPIPTSLDLQEQLDESVVFRDEANNEDINF